MTMPKAVPMRSMLLNPETAAGAFPYLAAALYLNVHQGGTFDYRRQGGRFLKQFTPVSNVNVGLFAQQASLSLEETLTTAGEYARRFPGNSDHKEPHGLHLEQLRFITLGYKIGQSGVFGAPATP